jgi:hypothetical protein
MRLCCFYHSFIFFTAMWAGIKSSFGSIISPFRHRTKWIPRCPKGGDTHGRWINSSLLSTFHGYDHLFGGNFHNIDLNAFSMVWLPENCSYHRFTNNTMNSVISNLLLHWKLVHDDKQQLFSTSMNTERSTSTYHHNQSSISLHPRLQYFQSNPPQSFIHLFFVGDSSTRGYICGIMRMLVGSEILGPMENVICGGIRSINGGNPASFYQRYQTVETYFLNNTLLISFMYVTTYLDKHGGLQMIHLESILARKPYAIILNTGKFSSSTVFQFTIITIGF